MIELLDQNFYDFFKVYLGIIVTTHSNVLHKRMKFGSP